MIRFPCLVCPPVLFIDLQYLIRSLSSCSPFSLALSHPRALSVGPAPRPTHDLPPVCPRRSPGLPRFPLGPGNDGGSSSVPPARPWVYLSAFPLESGPHSGAQVPLGRRWLLAVLSFLTLDGGSPLSCCLLLLLLLLLLVLQVLDHSCLPANRVLVPPSRQSPAARPAPSNSPRSGLVWLQVCSSQALDDVDDRLRTSVPRSLRI